MKKSLQEVLNENKMRTQQRKIEEIKRLKREQRKEIILTSLIALFILVVSTMLMYTTDKDFVNDCMEAGHTKSYCEKCM